MIDSLKSRSRQLAAILYLQNYEESTDYFDIKKNTTVLVVAMGDGNAYGMTDYCWIAKDAGEKVIWKMDYERTNHSGGATRNRIQIDVLQLKTGQYNLHYLSDDQHSYDLWTAEPPEHPELWGIQVFIISREEGEILKQKLKRRIIPNSLPHNWITALHEDHESNLWIGTADGLTCLRYDNPYRLNFFTVYKHDSRNPYSLNHSYISSIYSGKNDPDEPLWIITPGGGLNQFNRKTGQVMHYSAKPDQTSESSFYLIDDDITSILQDRNKNLWIGTRDDGLNRINLSAVKKHPVEATSRHGQTNAANNRPVFFHYRNNPAEPQSISDNAITAILEDRSGIIWIGTSRGGLNKINHQKHKFRHYTHMPDNPNSLSDKVVTAICEDDSTNLWVGTAGGGLNKLMRDPVNPFKDRYLQFKHNPDDPHSISHNYVSSIYEDQSGNLWVGTAGGGLNLFDRKTKRFKNYRYDPHASKSISGDIVNTIMEDQYGQLWIGTSNGLSKFDRFTERFTQYRHEMNNPYSLSNNEVWAIYEDSYSQGKTLWIGTRAGGLNKFDRKNEQFVRYIRDFDDPFSLNNPAILSIYQDKAGTLWFGTYSGGLNKFNRETEQFTFFTERDGLANNMIFGILEDQQGNLWLSTNKGISKFNPRENTFRNYDVYDGLQANEFNPGAYCLRQNGEMFFGCVNGMNSFFPDSVKDNTYMPPIVITAFSIFDTPNLFKLNRAIFNEEPIRLSYRENFLTIEFAALDYTNPRKNRYTYMLEGVNEGWIDCGTRRFASFTNLAPGEYTFRVKGSNNDGVWNHKGTSIQIGITPPFWKTWWFYLFSGALMVLTIISLHRYRLRHKLRRLMEIEQVKVQENERVRAKAAHDFHDELGHRLTKINLFSELAKRNLSNTSPEIVEYLNRIGETAKGLSGGMRDFIWTLDPEKDTLYEVAIRLKDFGDELFDKSGIAFRLEGLSREMENVRLSMDWRRHMTLIFKEAMNNVLKHSRGQNATLRIKLNRNQLEITLEDDGRGLPVSIFSENHDGAVEIDSPGNGLNNMQLRAQKIQGMIHFLNNGPHGTIVRFTGEIPHIGN
jgi:ligand-binding sensor domain-containing protein/signal transduction histidine kinase